MEKCIFCDIVNQKIKSYKLYEDELVYAFLDHLPNSNGHALVIPKQHFADLSSCSDEALQAVILAAKKVAKMLDQVFSPGGFNFVSNQGAIAYQVVFHFHLHIIPKYKSDEGFVLHRNIIRTELLKSSETFEIIEKCIKSKSNG